MMKLEELAEKYSVNETQLGVWLRAYRVEKTGGKNGEYNEHEALKVIVHMLKTKMTSRSEAFAEAEKEYWSAARALEELEKDGGAAGG